MNTDVHSECAHHCKMVYPLYSALFIVSGAMSDTALLSTIAPIVSRAIYYQNHYNN